MSISVLSALAGHQFEITVIVISSDNAHISAETLELKFEILISSLDITDVVYDTFSLSRKSCKHKCRTGS